MKQIAKRIFRTGLFLAIFLLLLVVTSFVFQPKGNAKEDGMYDTNPNGILAEPSNTVDVLILGDSEADCAFLPQKIWKDHGISVYICGIGGANPHVSFGLLRQAFENQSPKLVLLEGNHLFGDFSFTDDLELRLEEILPVFRYHNRWKNLLLKDFYTKPVYDSLEYQKGYHYDCRVNPANTEHYMEYTDAADTMTKNVLKCIRDMKQYCEDRGTELMLISVPSALNWNYRRHNGTQQVADQLGLQYVDMNLLREEIPIDWQTETQDYGDHVNFSGAVKVSRYTGEMLAKTGLFTDRRGGAEDANWQWVIDQFLTINELPNDALD